MILCMCISQVGHHVVQRYCLWVKQDMIRIGCHLINQTAHLLDMSEVGGFAVSALREFSQIRLISIFIIKVAVLREKSIRLQWHT